MNTSDPYWCEYCSCVIPAHKAESHRDRHSYMDKEPPGYKDVREAIDNEVRKRLAKEFEDDRKRKQNEKAVKFYQGENKST